MLKRGRPPAIESHKIVDAILEQSNKVMISESGNIVEKRNAVWETISASLNHSITPFSLYSYVTDDRFGVKSKLFERQGINVDESLNSINDTTAEESVNVTNASDSSFHENIKRSYSIYLTKEEFKALIVTKTRRCNIGNKTNKKGIEYKSFKPGIWEDTINDRLVESTKMTCGLSFKTHYITSDESSGSFKAYCNCGSTVDGIIMNDESNDNFVEVVCTIQKGSGKCGKRWLKGKRREETVKDMGTKTVHVYRAEKADEKMKFGDREPPNLPSSPVLRTARQQNRKKQFIHADPIKALQILKHTDGAFVIRNIGLDPFHVHFWSRHQLNIFRDYAAKGSSCLCIDATGKIIKKITKHGDIKSKSIYLYHGVIRLDEGQFPVLQMISESQNTNSIHFWLMEWVRSGASFPSEVVIDGGRAILTAAVRVFTNYYTIDDYADACYNETLPSCYVRMDNAHFMHTYVKLLKNAPSRVSIFYKAAIGQLIITRTREKAKKIVRALLLVSLCETDGSLLDGNETEVEKANKYIRELVTFEDLQKTNLNYNPDVTQEHFISNEISEDSNSDEVYHTKNEDGPTIKKNKKTNQWSDWGQNINEEVQLIQQTETGDRVNAHFMPAFAKKLISDLRDFPLWSCIMRDEFKFGRIPASSACVESEFNKVKNSVLKNEVLPMRVDEYVRKYVNYLNGRLKIISARIDEANDKHQQVDEEAVDSSVRYNMSCDNSSDLDYNVRCPACLNKEEPTGSHKCFICSTPVHNLDSCASPLDLEEGFGQKRLCNKCQKQSNIDVIIASRHYENWRGETTTKTSSPPKNIPEIKKYSVNKTKSEKKHTAKYYGEKPFLIKEQLQFYGKHKKIIILKNGSCESLRPVNICGKRVNAILTCPFDSVYQTVAAAVCDWTHFRSRILKDSMSNPILNLALEIFHERISFPAAYKIRTELHYNFMDHDEQQDGSILLRCETSVMQIVLQMFAKTPSCEILVKCTQCPKESKKKIVAPLLYISDIENGKINLDELGNLSMKSKCTTTNCQGQRQTSISQLGELVIFEIFNADEEHSVKLENLPKTFDNPLDEGTNYRLVGAVAYMPPASIVRRSSTERGIGHFTSLCLRGTHWVEYDDRMETEKMKKGSTTINFQILVYVKV